MSQSELGRRVNRSADAISDIETRKTRPARRTRLSIVAALTERNRERGGGHQYTEREVFPWVSPGAPHDATTTVESLPPQAAG